MFIHRQQQVMALLQSRSSETLWLDFKKTIPMRDPKQPMEICRDLSQFANTDGGCLLIGVDEVKDSSTGLKVANALAPITDADPMIQWVGQHVTNHLVPATFSVLIETIPVPGGVVLAFNVPGSPDPVILWDRGANTMQCVARNNHGKTYLNPDEMQRMMMDRSRTMKLKYRRALRDARAPGDLTAVQVFDAHRNAMQAVSISEPTADSPQDHEFTLHFWVQGLGRPAAAASLPYSLIRDVWVNERGGFCLVIDALAVLQRDQRYEAQWFVDLKPLP